MSTFARSLAAAAAASTLLLAGCAGGAGGGDSEAALGSEENPVRIGTTDPADYWDTFADLAAEEGISVEIELLSEYTEPNPALSEGDLDINQFQHIQYLADYNVASGDDLQPIGSTAIYPLGLYSQQYDSVEDIPDGETIVIPNDVVNQARALLVLQSVGLVELEDGGSTASSIQDVIEDESRVEVTAVDASITAGSLPDVAGAVINNNFLGSAGISSQDAIAADDPSDPSALPYVNVFVVRAEDTDDEVLNQLVDIYPGNQELLDEVQEFAGNTAVFTVIPADELQASLAEVQEQIESQQ